MNTRLFTVITIVALNASLPPSAAAAQAPAARIVSPGLSVGDTSPLQEPQLPELKSEAAAFSLSLLGTLVPLALGTAIIATSDDLYYSDANGSAGSLLIYTGLYLGPSLGYFYAGRSGRGWASLGLRNGIAMLSVLGVIAICSGSCEDDSQATAAGVVLLAGGAGVLASAIYDLAKIKGTVRAANEQELASRVAVIPTYSRSDGPGVRVSLAVR